MLVNDVPFCPTDRLEILVSALISYQELRSSVTKRHLWSSVIDCVAVGIMEIDVIFIDNDNFKYISKSLALGSPGWLVGWVSPCRNLPSTQENGC